MAFSRQEHWSGSPCPSPGDLADPGIQPRSPALQADSLPSEPPGNPSLLLDCQLFQDKKRVLFFLTTPHVLDRILHLVCDKHLIWGQLKPPNHPTWKLQLTKFLISLHFQSINWSSRFCFLISTKPSPPL